MSVPFVVINNKAYNQTIDNSGYMCSYNVTSICRYDFVFKTPVLTAQFLIHNLTLYTDIVPVKLGMNIKQLMKHSELAQLTKQRATR